MNSLKYYLLIILLMTGNSAGKEIQVLTIDGVINPVSADYLITNISEADSNEVECIIIQLDTPGGLMTSMRKIIKEMMNAQVPIIVYVAPKGARAGSAGVFITYASDVAAMAPGTNIGAAHPVDVGGSFNFNKDSTGSEVLTEKITNDAVAFIQSLAEQSSRNSKWAEKSVRESASISENKALSQKVVEIIADDLDDLLIQLDGYPIKNRALKTQSAKIVEIEFGFHRKILDIISDPNIAYILLMLGFWGLIFEIRNPGAVFPGVIGVICLILAFFSFQILPINYTGVIMIFLAIIMFILEAHIVSFGLLTIGGIILMLLGSMMLIDFTQAPRDIFAISWSVILPFVIFTAVFFIFAFTMAIKTLKTKATTGREGMIGLIGEAISDITENSGQVRVHGEIWNAVSDEPIEKNTPVVVNNIENMQLKVTKK